MRNDSTLPMKKTLNSFGKAQSPLKPRHNITDENMKEARKELLTIVGCTGIDDNPGTSNRALVPNGPDLQSTLTRH